MRITPLDVRNHHFSRRLSGLDRSEVESFLQLVSEDYEQLLRENEAQGERARQLEQRVEQLMADERLLKETLLAAQTMADVKMSAVDSMPSATRADDRPTMPTATLVIASTMFTAIAMPDVLMPIWSGFMGRLSPYFARISSIIARR